jgi:ABC-type methionine transport system permease subunit
MALAVIAIIVVVELIQFAGTALANRIRASR